MRKSSTSSSRLQRAEQDDRDLTRYDPATKVAGPLQGNNTVTDDPAPAARDRPGHEWGPERRLANEAGLQLQRDGTLASRRAVWQPRSPICRSFEPCSPSDEDPTKVGIARRLDTLISAILGVEGAVTGATETLSNRQKSIEAAARAGRPDEGIQARLTQAVHRARLEPLAARARLRLPEQPIWRFLRPDFSLKRCAPESISRGQANEGDPGCSHRTAATPVRIDGSISRPRWATPLRTS